MSVKQKLKSNKKVLSLVFRGYSLVSSYSFRSKKQNEVKIGSVLLKKSKLQIKGKNNRVIVDDLARLVNSKIIIEGDNNDIYLGQEVKLLQTDIKIFGNNNKFHMGELTSTNGNVEFNVLDGKSMTIGKDCMFSRNIHLWTGDFHSILSKEGKRINISEDIEIGDRVWVGTETNILKGAKIPNNSIIGAGSIVSGQFDEENIIIVGNPAKKVKSDVSWVRENIL